MFVEEDFIVPREYQEYSFRESQSKEDLEEKLINSLIEMGYEYAPHINNERELIKNLRVQLERLNGRKIEGFRFGDEEWETFLHQHIVGFNNKGVDAKTEKIRGDNYKINFEQGGEILRLNLIDRANPENNHLQAIGRYRDHENFSERIVTILVNGLPMVEIIVQEDRVLSEIFFDVEDKLKEKIFSSSRRIFEFIQIFVISNGKNTKYYSNSLLHNQKSSFLSTSDWSNNLNRKIENLISFARTFLKREVITRILTKYCIFDANRKLSILRSYQIEAIEQINRRIIDSIRNKTTGKDAGGYIWHTTGSGKTLTSHTAAKLAIDIPGVEQVIFVVDRKDLDDQTCKEYEKYGKDSVDSIENTRQLKQKLLNKHNDGKIIVTTIHKLARLFGERGDLKDHYFDEKVVIIIDECHRSQSGDMNRKITEHFRNASIFGFTGTPIIEESQGLKETKEIFGEKLHSYKITNAISDNKVLKFNCEYVEDTNEIKKDKCISEENKNLRRENIVRWILDNYDRKSNGRTFNGIFATDQIDSAIEYYRIFQELQMDSPRKLKVTAIFSEEFDIRHREEVEIEQEMLDEKIVPEQKIDLETIKEDYKRLFNIKGDLEEDRFRKDVSEKVRNRKIDILIVVNMFLTGFDAPTLNTLWVDKNLREHGLIQAFSRTNRIYNEYKTVGNIVCFVDLKEEVDRAIRLFADTDDGDEIEEIKKAVFQEENYREKIEEYKVKSERFKDNYPIAVSEEDNSYIEVKNLDDPVNEDKFVKDLREIVKMRNDLVNDPNIDDEIIRNINDDELEFYGREARRIFERRNDEKGREEFQELYDFGGFQTKYEFLIDLDYIERLIREGKMDIKLLLRDDFRNIAGEIEEYMRKVENEDISTTLKEYIEERGYEELKRICEELDLNRELVEKYTHYSLDKKRINWGEWRFQEILEDSFLENHQEHEQRKAAAMDRIGEFFEKYKNHINPSD